VASREQIAIRQQLALEQIRDVLRKYDTAAGERLRKAANTTDETAVPGSKQPDLVSAYLAECVASLAKIVDEQLKPRPRGRPRKVS